MAHTLTTCTFCGAGCGVYLETDGERVAGAYPSVSHPANGGRLCVRGWHLHEVASAPDRLRRPLIRRGGRHVEATWEEAVGLVAGRLAAIRAKEGPDAVAFLGSPRCSNEDAYLLQKLARAVVGTNNVGHGTGVYCNNSVHVLLEMLGVAAATNPLTDLSRSRTILVDGVDVARQLPTVAGIVVRAKLAGSTLIVVDTRRHRVAEMADLFLQIVPGTEATLYGAMAKVIVDRGLVDLRFVRERCRDYDSFASRVGVCDVLRAAEVCGVGAEMIERAAVAYASRGAAAVLYSTGVASRGPDSIRSLVNLVLLTGNLGKEGAALFPLAEQNNLQGVCDMGLLPDYLPGYRAVGDAVGRRELGELWGCELPERPGASARDVLSDGHGGRIRAMWLCRYDPLETAPVAEAGETLSRCEFVVAQHLFLSGAVARADVVLPETGFGQERVTFTSTERRVQVAEKVIDPPEGPLPVWAQLTRVARVLGAEWAYESAGDVMAEIGRAVPFYSGVTYEDLLRGYGRQWPCTAGRPTGTPRLFCDDGAGGGGGGGGGRFRFMPVIQSRPVMAGPGEFALVFGRSLYYWHRNVVTQHSDTLRREYRLLLLDYPDGFVEVNDGDARRVGVRDGQRVRLTSSYGSALSAARVTPEVRAGTVFAPYFVAELERRLAPAAGDAWGTVPVRLEGVRS